MQAFKISHLGCVSGLDQGFKSGLYQRCQAATQDRLLPKQIGLGLFFIRRLDNPGTPAAYGTGV